VVELGKLNRHRWFHTILAVFGALGLAMILKFAFSRAKEPKLAHVQFLVDAIWHLK